MLNTNGLYRPNAVTGETNVEGNRTCAALCRFVRKVPLTEGLSELRPQGKCVEKTFRLPAVWRENAN